MYQYDANSLIFCAILSKYAAGFGNNPQIFTKIVKEMMYNKEEKRRWNPVELYIDSYIAASVWLHLLCLYIWDNIANRQKAAGRRLCKVIAALVSAVADAVLLVFGSFAKTGGTLLFVLLLMFELVTASVIAFGRYHKVRNSLGLLGTTAFVAGVFQLLPVKNIGLFCCIGCLLIPVIKKGVTAVLRTKQTECMLYEAKLILNGKEKELSAFMDTGNRLRLIGSSVPVVVVDEKYLTEWIKEAECFMPQKLVILPYKGVGGAGLLRGIRVQCLLSSGAKNIVEREVAAVVAGHKLFQGCTYQMILQPEVIQCVKNTQEGAENVI